MRQLLSLFAGLLLVAGISQAATVQFTPRTDIQTHLQHLNGLAIADFNGDGMPDLAVTDLLANTVTVYLNNGTGGFGAPLVTNSPKAGYNGLAALVSGDVNEDGKQDLVVGAFSGLQYDVVLLGNGDGTFTPGQTLTSTYGFLQGALVDINGDKHLDLVAGQNGEFDVELGDGAGHFTQKPLPRSSISGVSTGLAVGDFDGDGHPDFLGSSYNSLRLQFFRGMGDGSFASPVTIPADLASSYGANLSAGDFNGDGKLDFLLGTEYIGLLVLGNGDGSFQTSDTLLIGLPLPYNNAADPNSLVPVLLRAADVDANGTTDVVAADDNAQLVSVLLNDGKASFAQSKPDFAAAIDAGTATLRTADLNGDGLPDIVLTNYKTQNISIFLSVFPKATPTVVVQSSASQALTGSAVSITVQVKGMDSHVPSGSVSLTSGSTSYGQQTLDSTGQATFALANLATGQYALSAAYAGDTYNNGAISTSGTVQSITDFALTLPTSTESIAAGSSATYSVGITALSGFMGNVTLGCSGLPAGFSCSTVSSTVSGAGATASLTVTPPSTVAAREEDRQQPSELVFATLGVFGLCFGVRRRRRVPTLLAVALVTFLMVSASGCGGSSSAAKATPYTGTSSFTVTASTTLGSVTVSHQAAATLTVHP